MSDDDKGEYDMAALVQEAIERLPTGFCILDADFRPILTNHIARDAFGVFFAELDKGISFADASYTYTRRVMPHLSDDQCKTLSDQVVADTASGRTFQLNTYDGRIFSAIHRRMSGDCYVAVYTDITQIRQRQKELKALKREAETANQAKSAFLANMSHEIRTPLNGVLGMAQVLVQADIDPVLREQVEVILESGKTLRSLMDDVLDLSKIETGRMELSPADKDILHVLKRQLDLWLPRAAEKHIGLRLNIAADVPAKLYFDSIRFGQCVSNLISNAIKFTEHGRIAVDVSARRLPNGIEISVAVIDTGIGMSAETMDCLFRPFTQADNSISRRFGGTGLGLVITRKLGQLMGGDVAVQSVEGKGSTFTLTMLAQPRQAPAEQGTGAQPGAVEAQVQPAAQRSAAGKRILLVDDHPLNRRVGRLFLEPHGYRITEAENGQRALDRLASGTFDIVLLDIHMPVLDGIETLKRIRSSGKSWASLPVIALTADAMSGDRERYLAEGMNGYIAKPIEQRQLLAEITRLLGLAETVDLAGAVSALKPALQAEAHAAELDQGLAELFAVMDSAPIPKAEPRRSGSPMALPGTAKGPVARPPTNDYDMAALAQEAIDCLPDGFSIMDGEFLPLMSNQVLRASFKTFYDAIDLGMGYREAAFLCGKAARPGVPDEERWQELDAITQRLLAGEPVEVQAARGAIFSVTIRPMSHERYVAVAMDITEQNARERELSESQRQAEAANQAKSSFLANMSHEIRTPLNGILGMAQVLVQGDLTTGQREQAEVILSSGKVLKAILDDVLDLSKIDAGRMDLSPSSNDLSEVLRRLTLHWQADAARKGLALRFNVSASASGQRWFDAVRLSQCVSNLVSNAIKFTERGAITIHAGAAPDGAAVTIAVSDSGIGIEQEAAQKLFQPFSQVEDTIARRFGGTGLGLVITRKLAELMGGGVVVTSEAGKGSTFELSFMAPATQVESGVKAASNPPRARRVSAPLEPAQARRVLLVDDNALNRRIGTLFLKPEGYRVTEAENGLEALERLGEQEFDIVLMDIHMHVLDGLSALKRIRASGEPWSTIPIIALTADAMDGDREKYLAQGMDGYISKPIEQRDLLAEIARLLGTGRSRLSQDEGAVGQATRRLLSEQRSAS